MEVPGGSRVTFWERGEKRVGTGAMIARIASDALGVGRESGASVDEAWTWRARYVDGTWKVVFSQPEGTHIGLELLDSEPGEEGSERRVGEHAWIVREDGIVN